MIELPKDIFRMILLCRRKLMIKDSLPHSSLMDAFLLMLLNEVTPDDYRLQVADIMMNDGMFFLERVQNVKHLFYQLAREGIDVLMGDTKEEIDYYFRYKLFQLKSYMKKMERIQK